MQCSRASPRAKEPSVAISDWQSWQWALILTEHFQSPRSRSGRVTQRSPSPRNRRVLRLSYGLRFSWLALHLVFLKVTTRIFPRGSVGSAGWLFQNTWVSGDVPGVSPRLTPEIFCSQPLVKIISLSRTRTALLQLIASSLNTLCNAWDNGLNKSFSKRISLNPGII